MSFLINNNMIPSLHVSNFGLLRVLLLCLWMLPTLLQAQEAAGLVVADTLSLRFRTDSIRVDMKFDGNEHRWGIFEDHFNKHFSQLNPASLRLDIYAGASPEGTAAHNRWLGENRGQSIRRLVRQRLGNRIGVIEVHNEGARWYDLFDRVAASNEPWRDEVLRIIELPASTNENQRDHRETKLRQLRGGKVWPVLLEKYLAPLRSGASATLTWQGGRDTIIVKETKTIVTHDTIVVMQTPVINNIISTTESPVVKERDLKKARRDSIKAERLPYPAWAVKTNLLLWGVVAPNIQIELPIGRNNRWSIELEYFTPWFIWGNNAHASQFQNIGLELRYWLGHRRNHRWLQGWHIGVAGAVGYYDWEWKKSDGYQGEHVNTYINIGYQHRWGKHWALDFGVGVGAMLTKYRHYYGSSIYPKGREEESDKHLIWHETGRYIWPGPCHANITLAYMFNAWPLHFKSRKIDEKR